MLGASLPILPGALPLLAHGAQARSASEAGSLFGRWTQQDSLPAFVYTADQESMPQALWDPVDRSPTRRHFHVLGNRALQVQVSNTGDVALFDESEGMRWLIYGDDATGTGHSVITEADGYQWGSAFSQRPTDSVPERTISCSGFVIDARHQGLELQRTVLCPEGDLPWVLVRVDLSLAPEQAPRQLTLTESWALRPRFLHIFQPEAERDAVSASVKYRARRAGSRLVADELFAAGSQTIGKPASIMLEALNPGEFEFRTPQTGAGGHPVLEARMSITLEPGAATSLWFRVGREVAGTIDDPERLYRDSISSLQKRLPVFQRTFHFFFVCTSATIAGIVK